MTRLFILSFILHLSMAMTAQEAQTIKFKRESDLAKAEFDNTMGRLIVLDRFGNIRDNHITSFKLYVKGRHETKEFSGHSNNLTGEMIMHLNRQDKAVKIFFTEIQVKDDDDHLQKLPDVIETWFPNCKSCPVKRPGR